jgi:hypothetical protein
MELGVDEKSWRYARQGIVNLAKAPSGSQLAELQRELKLTQEKLYRLTAFAKFWGISPY